MLNKNLSSFLERILRLNRAIGSNFECQFLVVGFLLDTVVVNSVLNIDDRGVDRVDSNSIDSVVSIAIFISRHITTALINIKINLETCAWIHVANHELWVQNLEAIKNLTDVTSFKHILARNLDGSLLKFGVFYHSLEAHHFKVEDYVGHVFLYARDCSEFVFHTINANVADRIALKR